MADIPVRQLRNDVSEVLRRVEQGESMTVSVSGRPVARLVPLERRPVTMPWNALVAALARMSADEALEDELAALLPETTDDL
jgi:prevent-host-death family protein